MYHVKNNRSKAMKDYMKPSVYGVGFPGERGMSSKYPTAYLHWKDMLKRAYSSVYLESNPSYKGVTVHKDWHDFRGFYKWYKIHHVVGYALDKDFLTFNNKQYGPDRCIYLSPFLNNVIHSGTGIHYNKYANKYTAQIQIEGKKKHLGYHPDKQTAIEIYNAAKADYYMELATSEKYNARISARLKVLSTYFRGNRNEQV